MAYNINLEFQMEPDLTLDDLVKLKENGAVPGGAKVSVRVSKGDRPWESDTTHMKLSWTENDSYVRP